MEALALDLKGRLSDRAITRVDLAAFSALKTFDPPITALYGTLVDDVTRHGKFLDVSASGLHLVLHLARAGWVRWRDEVPDRPPKPSNKSPLAARIMLDDGSGLDVTEAGTRKSLAMYVVRLPAGRPRHRQPRARPAGRRLHRRPVPRDPRRARGAADQGRAAPPGHDRRHRQRVLRRDPARREDVALQAGQQPHRDRRPDALRRRPDLPGRRRRALPRPRGQRAEGREEVTPRRARADRPARARSAATPCARCPSPTRACSTARPVRPAASRWPTGVRRSS